MFVFPVTKLLVDAIADDIATLTVKLTSIPSKTRTVITEQYRYTRNSKGEEQLFDLLEDPDEMGDLTVGTHPVRPQMIEVSAVALIAAYDAAKGAPIRGIFISQACLERTGLSN